MLASIDNGCIVRNSEMGVELVLPCERAKAALALESNLHVTCRHVAIAAILVGKLGATVRASPSGPAHVSLKLAGESGWSHALHYY